MTVNNEANKSVKSKARKQPLLVAIIAFVVLSLALVACGEATSTPTSSGTIAPTAPAAATATTSSSTNPATVTPADTAGSTAATTGINSSSTGATAAPSDTMGSTAAAATPGTTSGSTTVTPGTTSSTGQNQKGQNAAKLQSPDGSVKVLYNDVKNNVQKSAAVTRLLGPTLKASLKGSKKQGVTALDSLIGISGSQKISTITVGTATVNGDNATVTTTLKLSDGSTVTNNVTLVKSSLTTKQGKQYNLWQIDGISQAK